MLIYLSWNLQKREDVSWRGRSVMTRLRRTLGRHCLAYLWVSSPPSGLFFEWYMDDYPVLVFFFFDLFVVLVSYLLVSLAFRQTLSH